MNCRERLPFGVYMRLLFAERADRGRPHVRMVRVRVTVGRGSGGCGHRKNSRSLLSNICKNVWLVCMFCFGFDNIQFPVQPQPELTAKSQPVGHNCSTYVVQEMNGSLDAAFVQPFSLLRAEPQRARGRRPSGPTDRKFTALCKIF